VPDLVAGRAPRLDLARLARELASLLDLVRDPAWLAANAPPEARALRDIAISGNGEPTSSEQFDEVLAILERLRRERELAAATNVVLITNGSLAHRESVQQGLRRLAQMGGEVWFKLDAGDDAGLARINSQRTGIARARRNLELCARACSTWIQTLAFDWNGSTLCGGALERYIDVLRSVLDAGAPLRGVLLYGLARVSHQPEAAELRPLDAASLDATGARIRERTGLEVRVSV